MSATQEPKPSSTEAHAPAPSSESGKTAEPVSTGSKKDTKADAKTKTSEDSGESRKEKDSDETGDGAPKISEEPNSDGFIPGEPLAKNHPDTSIHAKDSHSTDEKTKVEEEHEHHKKGVSEKLKGMLHNEK